MATNTPARIVRSTPLIWPIVGSVLLWAGLVLMAVLLCHCAAAPRYYHGGEWQHKDGTVTDLNGKPISLMGKRRGFVEDYSRKEIA